MSIAGLKPKEEDIIVRSSKDGVIRKTISRWFCETPRRQFIIPLFQRRYLWEQSQCRKLFEDALWNSRIRPHDLGTVMVFVNDKGEKVIVDGQQRATTLMLLFASLQKRGASVNDILFYKNRPVLVPTYHDQLPFFSVISEEKPVGDSNVIAASQWFESWTATLTPNELNKMSTNLLDYFTILEFTIPRDKDAENLQVVYERLAIRSVEILSLMWNPSPGINNGVLDLTRNLFLSYYSEDKAFSVYHSYWMPLELKVAEDEPVYSMAAENRFIFLLRAFMSSKNWDILLEEKKRNKLGMYFAIKRYVENRKSLESNSHVTGIIQEMLDFQIPSDFK